MWMLWIGACVRHVTLSIETHPQNAVVILDGMPVCYESPCIQQVEKGRHSIEVHAEHFAAQSYTRELNQHYTEKIVLQAKGGWLSLTTEPSKLPIAVDGALMGISPLSRVSLLEGVHVVHVQGTCYQETQKSVLIESDKEAELHLTVLPLMRNISIHVENKIGEESIILIADGLRLGFVEKQMEIPTCTQHLSLVSATQWASLKLEEHHWQAGHVDMVLGGLPQKGQDSLLGYVPPRCMHTSGVDDECVHNWLERIRLEAEERNEHIHHAGCDHE